MFTIPVNAAHRIMESEQGGQYFPFISIMQRHLWRTDDLSMIESPSSFQGDLMAISIAELSPRELDALITKAKQRKSALKKRKPIARVRNKLAALADAEGYSLAELFGGPGATRGVARKGRKLGKVAPKYRNPANADETWSGRGKQPRWLAAQVAQGRKVEEFLIAGQAGGGSAKRATVSKKASRKAATKAARKPAKSAKKSARKSATKKPAARKVTPRTAGAKKASKKAVAKKAGAKKAGAKKAKPKTTGAKTA